MRRLFRSNIVVVTESFSHQDVLIAEKALEFPFSQVMLQTKHASGSFRAQAVALQPLTTSALQRGVILREGCTNLKLQSGNKAVTLEEDEDDERELAEQNRI